MTVKDLPIETKLIQLAEEASELSQAALKLVRAKHGSTPMTEQEARQNLLEEIADVNVCLVALDPDQYTVEAIMRQKTCRWERRINDTERRENRSDD